MKPPTGREHLNLKLAHPLFIPIPKNGVNSCHTSLNMQATWDLCTGQIEQSTSKSFSA